MKSSCQLAHIVCVATLCLTGWQLTAQSNFRFQHYTTRDGLASSTVEEILQDSLGFIWISYYGGLSRFDGYEFKVYQYDPEDSLKSPFDSEGLSYPQLDALGNLWGCRPSMPKAGRQKVVFLRYDHKMDGFVRYALELPHSGLNKFGSFNTFGFDQDRETIWITTVDNGLYKYNFNSRALTNYKNPHPDSITNVRNNWFRRPIIEGSRITLFGPGGTWVFDKETERFFRPNCDPRDSAILLHTSLGASNFRSIYHQSMWTRDDYGNWYLIDKQFRIIKTLNFQKNPDLNWRTGTYEDKDGNLWFTTIDKGLLKYDYATGIWTTVTKGTDLHSLKTNGLTTFLIDRDGNIWVGTEEEGVSVLRKQSIEFHNYAIGGFGNTVLYTHNGHDRLIVSRSETYPPADDAENELLTAPLLALESSDIQWDKVSLQVPLKGYIMGFAKGKNHLWISALGTGVVGFSLHEGTGNILPAPLLKIMSDPNNPNTIGTNRVAGIYEDDSARLWVTTEGMGITRVSDYKKYGQQGSTTHFRYSGDSQGSLISDFVYRIERIDSSTLVVYTLDGIEYLRGEKFERINKKGIMMTFFKSRNGNTYVGTVDGLYVLGKDSKANDFRKDPLIRTSVLKIVEDNLNRLWMSNLEGIMCYDPAKGIVLFFDEREGIDHTHGIIYQSSKGDLVTANIEGISIFNPQSLVIDQTSASPVLTALRINNRVPSVERYPGKIGGFRVKSNITALDELKLDYLHNNFSIEFSAMEMTAPEKNLYRHKLEGYDPDWIESDYKNRSATYTNLDAGTYTFRIKASNHHGVWSDKERTLKVIILPPPWKTAWAYTGYALIVVGLLFMARRMIVQRERLKGSLTIAKVEQEKEHFELEKAKEVDRVKTSFFTNISHEFRTPLTLIKGPVETLLDRFKDDPDVAQRLKLVQRNSEVLLRLINQLLDLAKLESGTMKIEKSNSDINSFIRAIAGSFESLASHKNVTLSVEISSDRNHLIFDKDKLETILINLINNAIKFTSSGGKVHVQASYSSHSLTMIVRDTGIGIPVEHQQKVFERFHQVSDAHKEVGTGIGLSLVKELILLLEGTITVSSEPGRGTTFTVTIPLETGTETADTLEKLVAPLSISNGHANNQFHVKQSDNGAPELPHVLVVEDNNDLRAFIIDSLGQEFYFLEADNGRTGFEVATTEIPDLIISDVMMPEMDGITMAGKIKSDHRSSHIPLILLTAKSTEDSKLHGLKSGADDYLTKPFNREELLLKVRNSISRQIKLREKLRAEVMGSAPAVEVMSEDERFLIRVKETILERLSDEQLSVESLAEDIGISRVHLYRKVSGLTGLSVNELIRKLRLQRAAQLIGQHWGPVSQVAYEVGYSNLSYFSKVFKEEFGVLPSEFSVASK